MAMSISLEMHDRRDGVEEGELRPRRSARGSPAASAGEVSGPVATMTLSQSAGGRPATSPRAIVIERMRLEVPRDVGGEAVAVDRQRAARRQLVASPAAMISEPARRISSCSRPTALFSASSERKELEHTSSASAVGLVRLGPAHGAHLVQHDRHAGLGDLPGGLAPGEPAADDMNEIDHGRS